MSGLGFSTAGGKKRMEKEGLRRINRLQRDDEFRGNAEGRDWWGPGSSRLSFIPNVG